MGKEIATVCQKAEIKSDVEKVQGISEESKQLNVELEVNNSTDRKQ